MTQLTLFPEPRLVWMGGSSILGELLALDEIAKAASQYPLLAGEELFQFGVPGENRIREARFTLKAAEGENLEYLAQKPDHLQIWEAHRILERAATPVETLRYQYVRQRFDPDYIQSHYPHVFRMNERAIGLVLMYGCWNPIEMEDEEPGVDIAFIHPDYKDCKNIEDEIKRALEHVGAVSSGF